MTPIAKRPDEKVEVTIEQLQHLLEVLFAGDVETAKAWLKAAIKTARNVRGTDGR